MLRQVCEHPLSPLRGLCGCPWLDGSALVVGISRVYRRKEVEPLLVGLQNRFWGPVLGEGSKHLVYSGVPTLGEVQLLEELAHPAVAVPSADRPEAPQVRYRDGPIRTGVGENLDPVWKYADLDGLARVVSLVLSEAPRYEKPPGKPAGRGLF